METPDDLDAQIQGIAVLGDPVRRSLYRYVASRAHDVGRDEAANAVGIARALAAFHLDKLAEEGLLDVGYRRLSERRGPGAGRPAKVYRRSRRRLELTLPRRRYDMLARMLATTVEEVGEPGHTALVTEARRLGAAVGASAREGDVPARPEAVTAVLADNGFEPAATDDGATVLRNCPFETLAREFTDLVCGANVAFMEGLLEGSGVEGLDVALEPEEGRCCAVFRPAEGEGPRAPS